MSTESSKITLTIEKPNADAERTVRTWGRPLQVHGERIGDLVFDLLRAAARPVGKDDHLVFAEVGDRVDGRVQQRPVAPNRKRGIDASISQRFFIENSIIG
jgi:hypothetical protein